jgi:trimeric autotransporter adhesin
MRLIALLALLPVLTLLPVLASAQPYLIETVAGGARFNLPAEPVPANTIRLIQPEGLAANAQGDVFIADGYYDRILRITPDGSASTFAGTVNGFSGDGGPAANARFNFVGCLTMGPSGDLFVCDLRNGRIRRINATTGTISTVVAGLANPRAIAFNAAGVLHFADSFAQIIGRVEASGAVTVVAGRRGVPGFSGDGGPATAATLNGVMGLAIDGAGNIYFSDTNNHRIRRVNPQGVIETFVGTGVAGSAPNNSPVATAQLSGPGSLAINRQGDIFVGDGRNGVVRRIRAGVMSILAGSGTNRTLPARAFITALDSPASVALDNNEQLLVADALAGRVYRIDPAADMIQATAGLAAPSGGGDGGPATAAAMLMPYGVAAGADGSFYVSDSQDHRVRKIDSSGVITTFAGNGRPVFSGDGGTAVNAGLGTPRGIAFDPAGNLYVIGVRGAYVRRITPQGAISTFAGGQLGGFAGDTGPATSARLGAPVAITFDRDGNAYIADNGNHRIRRVNTSGIISTVAGSAQSGFAGDGGPAVEARLLSPAGVAVDAEGNLFISDNQNNRIRRVDRVGVISTFVEIPSPGHLAFDAQGRLLVAHTNVIRAISPDGTQVVIAGGPTAGFAGDGGPATEARLSLPFGIAVARDESIYFADQANARVRKLTPVRLTAGGILNLASHLPGPIAANQLVRIRGVRLGPAEALTATPDEAGAYPKSLGGVEVLLDGNPIPLLSVAESSVVAIVPAAVAGSVRIQASYDGRLTNPVTVETAAASPGIFTVNAETGKGAAAARNTEGGEISADAPALIGAEVTIRLTGMGAVDPALADGTVAAEASSKPILPIEVLLGGKVAELLSATVPAGQPAGIVELKFKVPEGETGELPLVIKVGDATSQPEVTLHVGAA